MSVLSKTSFVKYAVLPGILPRISELLGNGFAFIAGLLAVIYGNIGLLPRGHAYLKPDNLGRFGIRHVMPEAGRNLVYSRRHIDQVILYYAVLIGLVLLALQFVLLIMSLVSGSAMAGSLWYSMFGTTPAVHRPTGNPSQDIAFFVLDSVFGVRLNSGGGGLLGFFQSCVSDASADCEDMRGVALAQQPTWPKPVHGALHGLLHFYTMGIAMISGVVLLYFIVAIVGETITSGTPFGQRFSKAWFVPRLIVFFALLAPIATAGNNTGINVAQLITLSAAKYGSNFATNIWLNFIGVGNNAVSGLLSGNRLLVARPNVPEVGALSQFMHVVRVCMFAEKIIHGKEVYPYVVRERGVSLLPGAPNAPHPVWQHDGSSTLYPLMGGTPFHHRDYMVTDFEEAVMFSRYGSIVIRFGHRDAPGSLIPNSPNDSPEDFLDTHNDQWGYVEPTCGELHIDVTSVDAFAMGDTPLQGLGIQENFYLSIEEYLNSDTWIDRTAFCMVQAILPYNNQHECVDQPRTYTDPNFGSYTVPTDWLTSVGARMNIEHYDAANNRYLRDITTGMGTRTAPGATDIFQRLEGEIDNAAYVNNLLLTDELKERGWAGAALWYNKIAELNGIMSNAMQALPRPYRYPKVMEQIAQQHRATDANASYADRFNPRLQNGDLTDLPRPGDQYIAAALYSAYSFWQEAGVHETVFARKTDNAFIDVINSILGTEGLYSIYDNDGVHPLAMLSALGKGMVDSAINNLMIGVGGQLLANDDHFVGRLVDSVSNFALRFGLIGLSVGFVLYYVLPLMPFIYFFFAFSGWVKSIFEAIVAMPLWAIAHVRIDGEGLPGPLATNGYFLLFEIFLRPTLIIVGLLASISLFAALVDNLHEVFSLVVMSVSGTDIDGDIHGARVLMGGTTTSQYWKGPIDEFFITVIYTVIVYMIGLSCFKLIDQIPNNIMRWMGVTVSTFHEAAGDPASEMAGRMYRASQLTNAQILDLIGRGRAGGDNALNTLIQNAK